MQTCKKCHWNGRARNGIECCKCESWSCNSCLEVLDDEYYCYECFENRPTNCHVCNNTEYRLDMVQCLLCSEYICDNCFAEADDIIL